MGTSTLIIPKLCKAGFNKRTDTYSGKLAYVIYQDNKKVWRKETSWNGWIQKPGQKVNAGWNAKTREYITETIGEDMAPLEFDNIPTAGFVLNRKVGGHSNGWNHRNTYCRVFDPRGFEFEIQVPNLLFILQEVESMPGKALSGEFVYAWDGKDLVLLPCSSHDYVESQKFTESQSVKISAKTLIPGATYRDKSKEKKTWVYLGRLDYCSHETRYVKGVSKKDCVIRKEHVFWQPEKTYWGWRDKTGFSTPAPTSLCECVNPECHPEFADLLEKYQKSKYASGYVGIKSKKITLSSLKEKPGYSYLEAHNEGKLFIGDTSITIYQVVNDGWGEDRGKVRGYGIGYDQVFRFENGLISSASENRKSYYYGGHSRTADYKTLEELFAAKEISQIYQLTEKGGEILLTN